jgi:hypothetical protein
MRGKNNGFSTVFNSILDGGDSTGYSLGVCDFLVGIERDVEVNLWNKLVGRKEQGVRKG